MGQAIQYEERWKDILDAFKYGTDIGRECVQNKTTSSFVTILGRSMTIKEAENISGIPKDFYKQYRNEEVPIEDIIEKLNKRWIAQKVRKLKNNR